MSVLIENPLMKPTPYSALATYLPEWCADLIHACLSEVGTELLFIAMFILGFCLFRVTAIKKLLGHTTFREKVLANKLAEDSPAPRCSEDTSFLLSPCSGSKQSLLQVTEQEHTSLVAQAAAGNSQALDAFEVLVARSSKLHQGLPEGLLLAVMGVCADSRYIQLAERCASYWRNLAGGKLSLELYSSLMKVYSAARHFQKTCDLYEAMRTDGVTPDTVAYGSLIRAAVESGRLELARRLFDESGNPDCLNYMSMIRAAGRELDVPKALRLLSELEELPHTLDPVAYNWAYNCTLEVCANCNDRAAAAGLLKRMEAKSCVDVVSYNTYLKIVLTQRDYDSVNLVLKNMRSRGIHPNVITYNSLIKGAVARQDVATAWRLIDEMSKHSVRPDAFTCSILLKGMKHTMSAKDVDAVIRLVECAKIIPDEVLVNCLLEACVRLGDGQRLASVLDRFKCTGVVPSPRACALLIKAHGHARRFDQAWGLWQEVLGRGARPEDGITEEVFASIVEACVLCNEIDSMAAVVRTVSMEAVSQFARAPAIFAAIVKACVQARQANLAVELYCIAKEAITCTKVTYNTLIDALVRQGDMAGASDLFRDMAMEGVMPDLITYSTLIKGHCLSGNLQEGLQLLGLMQRRGIAPDVILFNSILDGCAHKQMRSLTETVLKDMEAAGVVPSNHTLSILVKLYGRCGDIPAALDVVDSYPKKFGFQVNAQVYTCLMSACIANHEHAKALVVYETMIGGGCMADAKTYQTLLRGCIRNSDLQGGCRLISDVLNGNGSSCSATALDKDCVEGVLNMAARQDRAQELGLPLMQRLEEAGVRLSPRLVSSLRGGR
eukprot:TRINITY_DN7254_c0_g1_i1.p1 TRINITY_DN7254_c0_g1~~TRINITY_DN7254_c0_g1_i1.p1  ORF type:complete len:836 (+),score=226.71 TRINITY_DN7254_c0_g1_i1:94-2601(+)